MYAWDYSIKWSMSHTTLIFYEDSMTYHHFEVRVRMDNNSKLNLIGR